MSRSHLSVASLVLLFAVPMSWVACGGGKPAENPENATGDDAAAGASSAAAETPSEAPASSAAASDTTKETAPAAADTSTAAAAPPPAPAISTTDCGKCIEKACTKQAAACGKNNDCQSMLDAFHSCGSDKGASSCLDSATPPTAAKPKKLAAAYEACAKKAITSKACKASCSK
jgi:hypothetical protein